MRSLARFASSRILPRAAYPVVRGPLRGARFVLGALAGGGCGASVYFNLVEAQQTSAFVNTLGRGQVLFDIGANVGYYTILGSRLVGSQGAVIAFEPVVRNLIYLYKHVLLNRANNVTIVPAACSDTLSLVAFSSGVNYAMGHLADEKDRWTKGTKADVTLVPTVTVDVVVQQLGVAPDVIKIDVEGAEFLALKGAQATLLAARPTIFLSVHSEKIRSTCLEHLGNLGFECEALSEDKNNPMEFLAR
jgi:FkbM family methyltransferase